ncbi:MAG: SemiSWEET family transporter [Candidatus Diapherotrites archaeon]
MLETVFGVIAGVLTSVRLMPQVYRSLTIKETRDLSFSFLVILFFQAIFLILYRIIRKDFYIIYMNIAPLICSVILLYLKMKYK